jgi:hypothetical protein
MTNSAMTLFTVLANDEMTETLETFRTLCQIIPIYSPPYVADGLLQLGNVILSAFPNPRSDAWPVFRNALPSSHQQSPRYT